MNEKDIIIRLRCKDQPLEMDKIRDEINVVANDLGYQVLQWGDIDTMTKALVKEKEFINSALNRKGNT